MTVKQLMSVLDGFPEDTIIAYEEYTGHEYESCEFNSFTYDFKKKRLTFKN